MLEESAVCAAGFFDRIGQDRHVLEAAFVVYDLSKPRYDAVVPTQPGFFNRHGTKRVPKYLAQQPALLTAFEDGVTWIRKANCSAHV